MTGRPTSVSVILPTRDRLPLLGRTLEGYEAQSGELAFEVVAVDDGSSDGTWDWLSRFQSSRFRLRALRQDRLGPAAARNRAVREAAGEVLLFTGDDILPTPRLVEGHWSAHAARPSRAVLGLVRWHPGEPVSTVMRHVDGIGAQQFHYAFLRDHQRLDFRFFYGSNASLRRADLPIGEDAFDPAYAAAAFEDVDLAYRLMGERREIVYRSHLLAYHVHPHTLDSFCARQRRAGAMAAIFLVKHPEARRWFRYRHVAKAVERSRPSAPGARRGEAERFDALVRKLLRPHVDSAPAEPWIDAALIGLFRYEYEAALATAAFPSADAECVAHRLRTTHLRWPLLALARAGRLAATDAERRALGRLLEPDGPEGRLAGLLPGWRQRAELSARRFLAAVQSRRFTA